MKNKGIYISFYNGPSVFIDSDTIEHIRLARICTYIESVGRGYLNKMHTVDDAVLFLNKSADRILDKDASYTLFQKLCEGRDIASITIKDDKTYRVAWNTSKENAEINEFQTYCDIDNGEYLCIRISPTKTALDAASDDEFNN